MRVAAPTTGDRRDDLIPQSVGESPAALRRLIVGTELARAIQRSAS
jgi:hypothetical protein